MYRIYSTGIETAAASAILIPILFLYQIFIFHNIKKTAAYIIFILYFLPKLSAPHQSLHNNILHLLSSLPAHLSPQ